MERPPTQQGFGLFELVLVGILGFSIYGLVMKARRRDEPPPPAAAERGEVWSEEPSEMPPPPEPEEAEPAAAPEPEPEPEPDEAEPLPAGLTQADVDDVVGGALSAIDKCGRKDPADGIVEVRVTVEPSGRVSRVEVLATPDDGLGRCVARALKRLKFRQTDGQTTFRYPFAFETD